MRRLPWFSVRRMRCENYLEELTKGETKMKFPSDTPSIRIGFAGIMVVSASEKPSLCQVGILKDAPGHILKVEISKVSGATGEKQIVATFTDDNLTDRFSLKVNNGGKGISLFNGDDEFSRSSDQGHPMDFRWVLDFERDVYGESVSINKGGFRSIFELNEGLFFTIRRSDDKLEKRRILSSAQDEAHNMHNPETHQHGNGSERLAKPQTLGRVATAIGVNVFFDGPESEAIFRNGEYTSVLKPEEDIVHEIAISQSRQDAAAIQALPNHSVLYDQVIRGSGGPKDRIRLEPVDPVQPPTPIPPRGTDVVAGDTHGVCLTPGVGGTPVG